MYADLDVLRALRPRAKAVMVAEARREPAWAVLQTIPFFRPVRVARLLATLQTPWRFRTKRNLWAYAGLAVVTRSSADYVLVGGRPVRRRRAPLTRGLNQDHNRALKDVFKGAATAATLGRSGEAGLELAHPRRVLADTCRASSPLSLIEPPSAASHAAAMRSGM